MVYPLQLPVLPVVLPKVYTPVIVSAGINTFPYGYCNKTFDASCISIQGPTVTNYTGYQTLSLVISSACTSPLPAGCAENIDKIEINSCEWETAVPRTPTWGHTHPPSRCLPWHDGPPLFPLMISFPQLRLVLRITQVPAAYAGLLHRRLSRADLTLPPHPPCSVLSCSGSIVSAHMVWMEDDTTVVTLNTTFNANRGPSNPDLKARGEGLGIREAGSSEPDRGISEQCTNAPRIFDLNLHIHLNYFETCIQENRDSIPPLILHAPFHPPPAHAQWARS